MLLWGRGNIYAHEFYVPDNDVGIKRRLFFAGLFVILNFKNKNDDFHSRYYLKLQKCFYDSIE